MTNTAHRSLTSPATKNIAKMLQKITKPVSAKEIADKLEAKKIFYTESSVGRTCRFLCSLGYAVASWKKCKHGRQVRTFSAIRELTH